MSIFAYVHPIIRRIRPSGRAQVLSKLSILYSDQSVLEHHHLYSAWRVLQETRLLAPLSVPNFRELRSLMIEMVLHTDLSKHNEFTKKLEARAA